MVGWEDDASFAKLVIKKETKRAKPKAKPKGHGVKQSPRPVKKKESVKDEPRPITSTNTPLVVYTDGACPKNGKKGAHAGWGVHFPAREYPDLKGKVPGEQTNQRAELMAVLRCLEHLRSASVCRPVTIKTDSKYVIGCLNDWLANWKRNGWKSSTGKAVCNQEIIQAIDRLIVSIPSRITFVHVMGHSGDAGNDAADKLAVEAAYSRQ